MSCLSELKKNLLISSSSCVAPIKSQTIPRLVLTGALMLARLLDGSPMLKKMFIQSILVYFLIKNSDKIKNVLYKIN